MPHYICTTDDHKKRLDIFLTEKLSGVSRSHIQKMITHGEVLVNNKKPIIALRLRAGDTVDVTESTPRDLAKATPLALTIVYEDTDIMVIEKPSGVLTHPAPSSTAPNIVDSVLAHNPHIALVGDSAERPGIVHRLDKDASGLLLIAKTTAAFANLKKQFQGHAITKEYLALVYGVPANDSGTINFSIGRSARGTMAARPASDSDDRTALTHYDVVQHFPRTTLLRLRTETGRTHQIRTHLRAIGHPIVGDPIYAVREKKPIPCPRLFLHAVSLGFTHPTTDQWMEFTSALPAELQSVIDRLL